MKGPSYILNGLFEVMHRKKGIKNDLMPAVFR